jgi:hypothetical protein
MSHVSSRNPCGNVRPVHKTWKNQMTKQKDNKPFLFYAIHLQYKSNPHTVLWFWHWVFPHNICVKLLYTKPWHYACLDKCYSFEEINEFTISWFKMASWIEKRHFYTEAYSYPSWLLFVFAKLYNIARTTQFIIYNACCE